MGQFANNMSSKFLIKFYFQDDVFATVRRSPYGSNIHRPEFDRSRTPGEIHVSETQPPGTKLMKVGHPKISVWIVMLGQSVRRRLGDWLGLVSCPLVAFVVHPRSQIQSLKKYYLCRQDIWILEEASICNIFPTSASQYWSVITLGGFPVTLSSVESPPHILKACNPIHTLIRWERAERCHSLLLFLCCRIPLLENSVTKHGATQDSK